mmetsp:Transcript_19314/g.27950  ORF Transcript_19314/g.27950 Transcript_19314/m.27950 type:complete len:267 (+) Transcript_19314:114-914(+)
MSPLCVLLLCAIALVRIDAYPMIAEVSGKGAKCFRFNIPEDDDAHMLFVALPENVDSAVEEFYVQGMNEMNEHTGTFKNLIVNPPAEIKNKMDAKITKGRTNIFLKMQIPDKPVLRHQQFQWHRPIIMRNIVKMAARSKQGWEVPVGGYSICFENKSTDNARIVFDIALLNDDIDEDIEEGNSKSVMKKEHLTPLEKQFNEGIMAAHQILNEMRYMQQREHIARQTSETINARIRYFSYISVAVLIGVTLLQVTYLKSYFKKKKLL